MPVHDNSHKYEIPRKIEALLTKDFCTEFYCQLESAFPATELSALDGIEWDSIECSEGWAKAFDAASDKLCPELKAYVHSLQEYDCDMFADKVTSVLRDYGIIGV